MLVTVSTESMFNMEEALLDKASLYQLTVCLLYTSENAAVPLRLPREMKKKDDK